MCVGIEVRIGDCFNVGRVGKLGWFDDKVVVVVVCFNIKGLN